MAPSLAVLALLVILYTYIGYPMMLAAFSARRREPLQSPAHALPKLTVVIAVYNGGNNVASKLQSLSAVRYPLARLKVIVVDDGSTDHSADAALAAPPGLNVQLVRMAQNRGKPTALNAAMALVDTEFTVFMDVRQQVDPDCLQRLVARFEDPDVGAVSGELTIIDEINPEQVCVGLYWRYEKWLRERESLIYSTAGATGAVYAIRTSLYQALSWDTVLDDFDTPLCILKAGKRVVFEPGARVYDYSQANLSDEFQRKLRTLAGNYQSFHRNAWLFSLRENPIFWQFVSHKVLRVAVPWMALLLLLASAEAARDSTLWLVALLGQLGFYGAALATARFSGLRRSRGLSFVLTFCQLNVAAVIAPFRYYSGGLDVRWRT